jgi:ubiquinone/menaquinone biosynthesis C-methylase UbiE
VSGFRDHFSTLAARYADFRPTYPKELFAYLASTVNAQDLAWDCACGNGQASRDLAPYFETVIATDASAQQINAAEAYPKIEYRVAPAENSGLENATVDLVTVAQALHWFDLEKFYAEARRVLKRDGVLAVWTYSVASIEGGPLDEVMQDFYWNRIGPHWPPERRHVEEGYRTLPFPFPETEAPKFEMKARWTLAQLIGYFSSWSGTKRYIEANGKNPLPQVEAEMLALWNDPSVPREVTWPLALRVGRNE